MRQVIERERPDALLPTLGGQTALNLAKALYEDGTLDEFGVELIGANYDAIHRAEDREQFDATMRAAGPAHGAQHDRHQPRRGATRALDAFGLPLIIRPAFTLGGRGGGIARTRERVRRASSRRGLAASPIGQVLIDESVLGWGEFELEVMRDRADNVVIVCSIENVDPMGVHTGDSVTVAPQQTLTDRQYQKLRDQAIAVIRAVGVETGGSNVQFAVNPATDEIVVIEMNPRVSRSSALASKATGFPIAKIAARLAVGYTLDEIPNDITRAHAGELRADDRLRRRQVAALRVREVPGRRRRALHPHEVGRRGDGDRAHVPAGVRARRCARASSTSAADLTATTRPARPRCESPAPTASTSMLELLRRGASTPRRPRAPPSIDPWFLRELRDAGARPRRRRSRGERYVQGGRHLRGRVRRPRRRTTTRAGSAAAAARGPRAATGRA